MAEKLLLSPEEACALIGVRRATFFKLLRRGEIPSIKVGHLRRIPVAGLNAWVQQQVAEQMGDTQQRD